VHIFGQALFAPINNFSALSKSAFSAWKRIGWKFLEFLIFRKFSVFAKKSALAKVSLRNQSVRKSTSLSCSNLGIAFNSTWKTALWVGFHTLCFLHVSI
jgi:hypothetical protein